MPELSRLPHRAHVSEKLERDWNAGTLVGDWVFQPAVLTARPNPAPGSPLWEGADVVIGNILLGVELFSV